MTASKPSLRPLVHRLACATAAAAALSGASMVQAEEFFRPGSVYAAANLNLLQADGFECQGSPICERPRIGGKLFGGYRFTPNLATEVAYYYMGNFKSVEGPGVPAGQPADTQLRNSGFTVGIDWSNELFQVLTQHIRFGLSIVRTEGRIIYGNNTVEQINEYKTAPYLGLGLSYQFNPHVRFYQGYDVLRTKRNGNIHVLSMGVGIEN